LAYNVVVSHAKEIFHVTPGFAGAMNDKTVVRYDYFVSVGRCRLPVSNPELKAPLLSALETKI
jgi:hypothetical protein